PHLTLPQCGGRLTVRPATLPVANVADPDGEDVTLELRIFAFGGSGTPLFTTTRAEQPGETTALDVSTMAWTEDAHYLARVRAGDGTAWTGFSDCDFILDELPAPVGGNNGGGADGGSSGSQAGSDVQSARGCSSAGA